MSRRFRLDVRLVRSAKPGLLGFQRGRAVVWVPEALAEHAWRHPDDPAASPVIDLLQRARLLEPEPAPEAGSAEAADRNRIFAAALCEDAADRALAVVRDTTFAIVGCGGLGSAIATILAALSARTFVLVDGDAIEPSNLNRLLWASPSQIGERKVTALAAHLASRFQARADVLDTFLDASDLSCFTARPSAFVVIAVDDHIAARRAVARLHRDPAPYVHVGYVGRSCSVGPLVTGPQDPCPFCGAAALEFVDAGRFTAPSAAPNNLLIAAFVSAQLLRWAAGVRSAVQGRRWVLDLADGRTDTQLIRKDARCPVCSPTT